VKPLRGVAEMKGNLAWETSFLNIRLKLLPLVTIKKMDLNSKKKSFLLQMSVLAIITQELLLMMAIFLCLVMATLVNLDMERKQ